MRNDKSSKSGAKPTQSGSSRPAAATPSAAVAQRLSSRKGVRTRVKSAKLALEAAEAEARRKAARLDDPPPDDGLTDAQRRARGKGRPSVDELVRRQDTLATKVNGHERALIMAKADQAGMTVSTYLREIAKSGRVSPRIVKSPASADPALLMQLIPIGNNLNQIAHSLNAMRGYVPADLHKNLSWLGRILETIQTLDEGQT